MKLSNVYSFLENADHLDLIIEFRDGDAYSNRHLDLPKVSDEDYEPIWVWFKDCVRRSKAWEAAMKAEPLSPLFIWTSGQSCEPVGRVYLSEDIVAITDVGKGYKVYEVDA